MPLTGCGNKDASVEDIASETARETQTLVVYLMSEEEVDPATEFAVEEAINTKTKAKFKTQLDLRFFTEETYYTEVEAKLKAKEKEIKAENSEIEDSKNSDIETNNDEGGKE